MFSNFRNFEESKPKHHDGNFSKLFGLEIQRKAFHAWTTKQKFEFKSLSNLVRDIY
jgi:hypothetical protein